MTEKTAVIYARFSSMIKERKVLMSKFLRLNHMLKKMELELFKHMQIMLNQVQKIWKRELNS